MVARRRRSPRLAGYDYARAGAYFVTVCTAQRAPLFGVVVDGLVKLNAAGELAEASWTRIPEHFAHVTLDEFVVMPNHVHGVLILEGEETSSTTRRRRLGTIIGSFKSAAAKAINERRGTSGSTVWHRSFYDHIIRNEDSLGRIRRYIQDNPARWQFDVENPMRVADPSGREDEDW